MAIIEPHREWLVARGITDETIEKFGLHTHSDGQRQWLRVPFMENGKAINHKWRKTGAKNHRMDKDAAPPAVEPSSAWSKRRGPKQAAGDNRGGVGRPDRRPIRVATGHVASRTAHLRIYRGRVRGQALRLVSSSPESARQDRQVYLGHGRRRCRPLLAADLARLLGPERCWFIEYPDNCKDLNEVALCYSEAGSGGHTGQGQALPGGRSLQDERISISRHRSSH